MPRRIFLAAVVVAAVLWLAHELLNRPESAAPPRRLYPGTITIGMETWPGYLALVVARDKGYFREEGLQVEIKRYTGLGKLSRDYTAGKIQARANLTLDAANESLRGLDHKAVLVMDYSNGADAIAARGDIRGIGELAGKRVGYEADTLEEFFLAWVLNQYGLSLKDVISVPGSPQETARMLEEGRIDVAVTHEPFLSKVIKTGKAHLVYSSAKAPGLITDILTFRTDFIEAHPESVKGVLRAYFRALDLWKKSPEEACALAAREFGESPESIQNAMGGITMLDLNDNRTAFSFAAGLQSLHGNMRKIGAFIYAHQKEEGGKEIDASGLIESRFIHDLLRERQRADQP